MDEPTHSHDGQTTTKELKIIETSSSSQISVLPKPPPP